MGKRSDFVRKERDWYPTPMKAVEPLLPHLLPGTKFDEPCAGDGQLVEHLITHGHLCTSMSDIEPQRGDIEQYDIFDIQHCSGDYFITNPPWDRKLLHPIIETLAGIAPTWLLFDSDWCHTKQSVPYMQYCSKIVSIGRIKWIPDSKMSGKDNCCWHLFDKNDNSETIFIGRS
jgi:hypothetical protein